MDALEKRIKALQESLQTVETPDTQAIWAGIKTLPEPPKPWWRKPWWWIIGAVALLGAGAGLGIWWNESQHQETEPAVMATLPEAWRLKAVEYQKLVSNQENHLRSLLPEHSEFQIETSELELLDSMQRDFMADFQTLPKDEKTASRYLHYYEQKIRILELIIKEIQLRKNETEKRPSIDI